MSTSSGSGVAVPDLEGVRWGKGIGAGLTGMRLASVYGLGRVFRTTRLYAPGTSFSTSLRSLGGPPCSAVICCRREAPLFAAECALRSLVFCLGGQLARQGRPLRRQARREETRNDILTVLAVLEIGCSNVLWSQWVVGGAEVMDLASLATD